jgi:hypothetical protein
MDQQSFDCGSSGVGELSTGLALEGASASKEIASSTHNQRVVTLEILTDLSSYPCDL